MAVCVAWANEIIEHSRYSRTGDIVRDCEHPENHIKPNTVEAFITHSGIARSLVELSDISMLLKRHMHFHLEDSDKPYAYFNSKHDVIA